MSEQPRPVPNDRGRIVDMVIDDLQKRDEMGHQKYGTSLQPFNGRDPLLDAYEETLDKAQYLKQELVERRDQRVEGAAEERAAIVRYLRDDAESLWGPQAAALVGAATCIENLCHRRRVRP